MKTKKLYITIISLLITFVLSAQDSTQTSKGFNIAIKNYGLSFGNSPGINGLRFNFQDKNLHKVNGLNFTIWKPAHDANKNSVINGVALGLVMPYAERINGLSFGSATGGGQLNGLHIGLLGLSANKRINGIGIGGLGVGCDGNANGLLIGGLGSGIDGNMNGILFSGLGAGVDGKMNGIALTGLGIGIDDDMRGLLFAGLGGGVDGSFTGLAFAGLGLGFEEVRNGLTFSLGKIEAKKFQGLNACSYFKTENLTGISIAIFNRVKELHGLELGLINYAGNNPRGLRVLPLVNMHF